MKACGVIVEYNPLHNGHVYHIQESKKISKADCIIAVMSGSFLQRGEPAIIDKFHRTKAALQAGVDIVLELPFMYAVQSSELFAQGAVQTLNHIGASSICFGSESGSISHFITSYTNLKEKEKEYEQALKSFLQQGLSFPVSSEKAKQKIDALNNDFDISKPNNILGFSYIRTILDQNLPIEPLTIKRINNDFHDTAISNPISSATSIRKELVKEKGLSQQLLQSFPHSTEVQLLMYKENAGIWHTLEHYFPLLHYRVQTMSLDELAQIQGVNEGLEHRIKQTAKQATSMNDWINRIKTKRYTWTRIQRLFIHLLTNTTTEQMQALEEDVPYVRILGFSNMGQEYLHEIKKQMEVPLLTSIGRNPVGLLAAEEKATAAYYSVLSPDKARRLIKQEITGPVRMY
ncbi:nucleotidyltransferase [Ornithinibacillus sp. 4-3]|uniref:tRNA(Met) cytidine acetate ligase n=1 Tax=Ornithinibacillus sp. 4-3 TaxID=3231488 RepID=A0AB39HTK9_9BACI